MHAKFNYVCFGEVLWDLFPEYEVIGGAPLNVALRLNSLAGHTAIISAVGTDKLGIHLLKFVEDNNLPINYVQVLDNIETGAVQVTLDANGSASYDIEYPKAWDHISLTQENLNLVSRSEVFIYGSLVARDNLSHQTLLSLLKVANFKVFDMNLRSPYYTFSLLKEFMKAADFLKMNDEELDLFCEHLDILESDMKQRMLIISNKYDIYQICVTRGKDGAMLLIDRRFYEHSGYPIIVKDTVGAGDSFLASLIYQLTSKNDPQASLDFACAVGAIVAQKEGGNPKITKQDILEFIKK